MLSIFGKKNDFFSQIKINCAIFSAMPEELAELENSFSLLPFTVEKHMGFVFKIYNLNQYKIILVPTGIGTVFAASAVTLVNTIFKLDCMLFIGTSGGIDDNLNIRDIVLVNSAYEAESQNMFSTLINTPFESCLKHPLRNEPIKQSYFADADLISLAESSIDFPVIKGGVVSSNVFPSPKEIFPILKQSKVLSIDMETSAFYQVAWLLKIPSLAIRAISNKLDCNGDDENIALSDVVGSIKVASTYVLKLVHVLAENNSNILENSCKETACV